MQPRSWRTTVSGLVGAGAGLVIALNDASVQMPHWVPVVAHFIFVGGFASLGIASMDTKVNAGQVADSIVLKKAAGG